MTVRIADYSTTTRMTLGTRQAAGTKSAIAAQIIVPVHIDRTAVEYLAVTLEISVVDDARHTRSVKVGTRATTVVLSAGVATTFVSRLMELGAKISSGQLEQLVSRAILSGQTRSPSDGEMEFLNRFGSFLGPLFHSTSGQQSDVDANDVGVAGGMMAAVGTVMMATATAGGVVATGGLALVVVGGAMVVGSGVVYFFGGGKEASTDALYPDIPPVSPEAAAQFMLLLASIFGDHVLRSTVSLARGGEPLGAPDREESGLLGRWVFDAAVLALVRDAVEGATGGHVTTPAPGRDNPADRGANPSMVAIVDPLWDPILVRAALVNSTNRGDLIDQIATKVRLVGAT